MKPKRTYTRHGLNAVMVRVKLRGFKAIDRRTVAARSALDWRRELLDDLGGEMTVSAAQLALVEVAVRTRLYLDHVDAVLLERQSLVIRGQRLLPLVEQRGRLADSMVRVLGQLGIERRQAPVKDLRAYLEDRYGARQEDLSSLPTPAERNGIPVGPSGETSATETGQEPSAAEISAPGQELPTTAGT